MPVTPVKWGLIGLLSRRIRGDPFRDPAMHANEGWARLLYCFIFCDILCFIAGCGPHEISARPPAKVTSDSVACRAISFTPDGKHLLVGGSPRSIRSFHATLWDTETGSRVIAIPNLGCERVAFSPDSTLFVTGGWLGETSLWNANTGEKVHTVTGHRSPIRSLAFSFDGEMIATADDIGLIKLWKSHSLTEIGSLNGHSKSVTALTFSADSQFLATGSADKTVRLWSTKEMQQIGEPIHQEWSVWFLSLSPDDRSLVTAGSDCGKEGGLKLWGVPTRTIRKSLPGYHYAAFAPNGELWAAATSTNATVVLFDQNTGEEKQRIGGNQATHYTLGFQPKISFAPDGQTLAVGVQGVSLVNIETGASKRLSLWTEDWIDSLAYSPDGRFLAVSPNFKQSALMDLAFEKRFDLGPDKASSFAFSPDGTRLISSYYGGSDFGTVAVLNARSGKVEAELFGHLRPVTALAVSQDGKILVSGSQDRTTRIWNLDTKESIGVLEGHGADVYQVAIAPGSAHIATASDRLRIWNVQRRNVEQTFDDFNGLVYSVAYSPAGDLLLAGGADGTVMIWETIRWKKRGQFKSEWPIRSLAFSPDGNVVALAGGGVAHGIVELRHAIDLSPAKSLEGHKGSVTSVKFSLDGQSIVTSSIDKTWKRWDVKAGRVTHSSASFEMSLSDLALSPTGSQVVVGGFEGINLPSSK